MASIGALAGYINAQRTGKGDSVDVAQYEAMLRCEGFYALNYLNMGALPVREGSHSTPSAGYGTYICQDGVPIYTLILGPGVVRAALPLFGPSTAARTVPRGHAGLSRSEARRATCWRRRWRRSSDRTPPRRPSGSCWKPASCSRIYTYEMAERDPHYQARESFTEWKNSYDDESIRGVNVVPCMKNNPGQIWRGMPLVGADNEDILEELRHARRCRQPLRRAAPQEGERPLRLNAEERDKGTGIDVLSPVPSLFRAADRIRR